jgi:hypothetical protein
MKTTLFAVLVLVGSACAAQIGVVTLPKRAKEVPVGQWFTFKLQSWNNTVSFYNTDELVHEKLSEILKENELFFEEHQIDQDGDKYWVLDKENGFTSYMYLIPDKEGWSNITVYTEY